MEDRKIILVVDDSSANLQLCKGLLSNDYDVRLAKSGKMALAALERIIPDIILLDIEMPDMTGFEVMDEIKKNPDLARIPVLFVTSHASEKIVLKALDQGATDYIVKPFVSQMLYEKLIKALKSKR
ncbi:MAG: response regulator [Synergistaceae bacterium]|nr:response regulator [Synergistaceae bacterium]